MQATKISNQAFLPYYHPHYALQPSSLCSLAAAKMEDAPYAGLLEPDVCGEESEANFGIHIEPKCDSAICVELSDALVSLASDYLHARIQHHAAG